MPSQRSSSQDETSRLNAKTRIRLLIEGLPWEVSPRLHDQSHYMYMFS